MILGAFLLRASRVLLITPSRMVRDQLADQFGNLHLLKLVGAIDGDLPPPRVTKVEGSSESIGQRAGEELADAPRRRVDRGEHADLLERHPRGGEARARRWIARI
jgi:hypothetical protein